MSEAVGCLQLCARQRGGCEAAILAMQEIFMDSYTKGVLIVDTSNAFNSLNRLVALLIVSHLQPFYHNAASLLILLMATLFGHVRVPLREIHWLC